MKILLGTLAYMAVTFPYAIIWHMKLFKKQYIAWGYFGKNPKPAFGLLAMVFQGSVLTYIYSLLDVDHQSMAVGICYALTMGIFFWSSHVVAAMAKHDELRNLHFFMLETVYLVGQFVMFGVVVVHF